MQQTDWAVRNVQHIILKHLPHSKTGTAFLKPWTVPKRSLGGIAVGEVMPFPACSITRFPGTPTGWRIVCGHTSPIFHLVKLTWQGFGWARSSSVWRLLRRSRDRLSPVMFYVPCIAGHNVNATIVFFTILINYTRGGTHFFLFFPYFLVVLSEPVPGLHRSSRHLSRHPLWTVLIHYWIFWTIFRASASSAIK